MQFDVDMISEHKDLFIAARKLLLSHNEISETKKPRITTYGTKSGGVCHMRTMPHGIDFGFLKGVKLDDPQGLLSGKGKTLRVLSLKTLDVERVEYFIKQAIALNESAR